ncbi:hypothetical protein PGC34_18995 [Pseudomonas kribbensis]|uniref:hypothetical protein n=1 Tax=Pseudomonas kribbensis TaxID=1628086 RepID=UPI003BF908FA
MRRLFSNIEFLFAVSSLIVLTSAAASIWSYQWHWFGRSGAILTIAGLLLTFRPLVRMGLAGWLQSQSIIDCGHVVPTEAEAEADRQAKIDGSASKWGMTMAIVGTLVWAYGDLIGGLPH